MGFTPPSLQQIGFDKTTTAAPGSGDVVGPSGATDTSIALFDTGTGKLLKEATGVTHANATKTTTWEDIGVFGPKGTRVSPDGIEMWDDFKGTGTLQIGFAEDGAPRFDIHGGLQVDDTAVFADTVFAADFQLTNPTEGQPPAMIQFNAPTGQVAVDQKFLAATEATLNGEVLDGDQTYVQITQNGIKQWKLAGGSSFDIEADPTGPLRIGANGTIISEGLAGYPDMSAILDLNTTYRGFLPPRLTTTQRDAISSPANGLLLYNTTTSKLTQRVGASWVELGGTGDVVGPASATANRLSLFSDTTGKAIGSSGLYVLGTNKDTLVATAIRLDANGDYGFYRSGDDLIYINALGNTNSSGRDSVVMAQNAYIFNGSWARLAAGTATKLEVADGHAYLYTSETGAQYEAITWSDPVDLATGGGTGTSPSYFRREQADTVTTYSATNTSDTDSDGNWQIVKEVVSGVTRNLLSVYTATAAWTNRASATYTLSKTYNLAL